MTLCTHNRWLPCLHPFSFQRRWSVSVRLVTERGNGERARDGPHPRLAPSTAVSRRISSVHSGLVGYGDCSVNSLENHRSDVRNEVLFGDPIAGETGLEGLQKSFRPLRWQLSSVCPVSLKTRTRASISAVLPMRDIPRVSPWRVSRYLPTEIAIVQSRESIRVGWREWNWILCRLR